MQLSLHADYGLRVLLYLGANPGRVVRTREISDAYHISRNHLVRVVESLAQNGYLRVSVGRSGGISLALDPRRIRIGDVVMNLEPNLDLVECFDPPTNTCPIIGCCELKPLLKDARDSFLTTLNRRTLADLLAPASKQKLRTLLINIAPSARVPA